MMGGAKVSDKLPVIASLLGRVNAIIIGGGMAYTFLKTRGINIGDSLVDESFLVRADRLLTKAERRGVKILLPVDHIISTEVDGSGKISETKDAEIPSGWKGVDIGPKTVEAFAKVIRGARTIFWNGPMGIFEQDPFHKGTNEMARIVSTSSAFSIVGGGDSLAAINRTGVAERISHLSTGGGAALQLLEGKTLAGVRALEV